MKKVFVTLLMGVGLLFSGNVYADDYSIEPDYPDPSSTPNKPGMPAFRPVIASIDAETGELCLLFNREMSGVEISISKNGVMYENDIVNVIAGQTHLYDMSVYNSGIYTLSIEVDGDIIAQYSIIVEKE